MWLPGDDAAGKPDPVILPFGHRSLWKRRTRLWSKGAPISEFTLRGISAQLSRQVPAVGPTNPVIEDFRALSFDNCWLCSPNTACRLKHILFWESRAGRCLPSPMRSCKIDHECGVAVALRPSHVADTLDLSAFGKSFGNGLFGAVIILNPNTISFPFPSLLPVGNLGGLPQDGLTREPVTEQENDGRKLRVTCIVLNWNGWKDTVQCLVALQRCTHSPLTTIVVDNGSTDDSASRIRLQFPDICVLETGKNLGFAGGNNVGIRYALDHGADFIWLLNNDTEPAPDALSALVTKALTDDRIGAVASICYHADAPSTVQVWAGTRVNLWIGYARNATEPQNDEWFDALYGASLLIRRTALEDVGLLDAGFFFYWEETEFCVRLRKRSWRLAAAPDSSVLHKTSGTVGNNMSLRDRYSTASALRILRLHSSAPALAIALFLAFRLGHRLIRREFSRCIGVWAGVRDYCRTPQTVAQANDIL